MRRAGPETLAAFDRLPRGTFGARQGGRRRVATRSVLAGGRAEKLVAELAGGAAGGAGYVSMNLYRLRAGARLVPCEMEAAAAGAFVLGIVPEDRQGPGIGRARGWVGPGMGGARRSAGPGDRDGVEIGRVGEPAGRGRAGRGRGLAGRGGQYAYSAKIGSSRPPQSPW